MLKSDQQGFLIGEVLDVSKAMLKGQEHGLESLGRIESLLRRPGRLGAQRTRSVVIDAIPAEPVGRRSPVLLNTSGAAIPLLPTSAASRSQAAPSGVGGVAARDDRGRFVKRDGTGSPAGKKGPGAEPRAPAPDEARGSSGENRIVEAIKETAANSTDRMDPMIEAAKEVWEPLGRGWRASFGQNAERKKERWYKRIWQALTRKKGDGQDQAVAAGSSSGLLSGIAAGITSRLAGLAGMIPAILARVFAPVAAAWAAWEVGQWIGGKINDWLVSSGLQDKLFAWVDSMRAGWASMMDRLSRTWEDNVSKPAKKAVAEAVDAAGRAYDGGVDLLKGAATSFSDGAAATNSWIEQKTGIDVGTSVKGAASTAGGALGALIGRHEGHYGSFNRGRAGDSRGQSMNFANMTIGEIMQAQALPAKDPNRLFAVGKYQVIPKTLKEAVEALGINKSEKFTPEIQEAIFSRYLVGLKRKDVSDYLSGRSDDVDSAVFALSKEFASVQNPRTGKGYYDGVAGNRASINADAVRAALKADRTAAVASPPAIQVPSIRSMSLVKPIGEGPEVSFPSMPSAENQPIKVSIPDQIGQNVSDRSIAHITTGGLGM